MPVAAHVRGLQRIWVKQYGLFLYVWCHDDGDLDRDKRIAFMTCSSPGSFWPPKGQFLLADVGQSTYNYVYGIPYAIEEINGVVKVHFTNLSAYSNRRQAYNDSSPQAAGSGKSKGPKQGSYLEGLLSVRNINGGPFVWTIKAYTGVHNNPSQIIEATDIDEITEDSDSKGFGAPTGTLIAAYDRDAAGHIQLSPSGAPMFKKIDESGGDVAQNYKIGYLALRFVAHLFGNGMHGWVGSGGSSAAEEWHPFKAYKSVWRGTGDAPADQAFRWRVACGTIDAKTPTNRNEEFVLKDVGTNFIWLYLEYDADLVLITRQLASGDTLPDEYISESGTAVLIVPIFSIEVELDDPEDFENDGVHYVTSPAPIQHVKTDLQSGKTLISWSCEVRRYRPYISKV